MIDLAALKSRIDLHATIAERVHLQKRGRTWWGRCPFHHEDTPSFTVHAEYFYCHGCHAKGDVITFTAMIEGISKGRAIHMLAERAGMEAGKVQPARESAYKRDLEAQAAFWWRKLRERAVARLGYFCGQLSDVPYDAGFWMAHIAGARVRVIDSIGPELRGRIFLRMRTAADAREWQSARKYARWWSEISKGLTVMDWIRDGSNRQIARAESMGVKDPADFVQKFGGAAFRRCVENAPAVPMELLGFQIEMEELVK